MGTLFLPFPLSPFSSSTVALHFAAGHRRNPDAVALLSYEAHHPRSLLPSLLLSVLPLLVAALSSSDGDLSHLRHRCRRRPKIRISSIFHPTSSSLSLVFHGFFICASPPLLSDFDRHLSGSGSGSGSSTVRVPPRPPSPSLAPPPWPDPQPTTASLSFLLFLFPPPPLPSISLVFLHRRRRLPVSLPSLFSPPAPPPLPLLSSSRSRRRFSRRPPASSPVLAVTPAPHSPPPSPSSSVSVPIASLDVTAVAFSAVASLRLCCRPPPPPLFSPSPPSWLPPSRP